MRPPPPRVRYAEVAPADALVAVENECRVWRAVENSLELSVAVQLRCLATTLGMEAYAPAATEDAVVGLHKGCEGWPCQFVEWCHFAASFTHANNPGIGHRQVPVASAPGRLRVVTTDVGATIAIWSSAGADEFRCWWWSVSRKPGIGQLERVGACARSLRTRWCRSTG